MGTKTGFSVWSFEVVDLPDGYEGCLPSDGLGVAFRAVDVTPVDVNASGRVSLDALSKVDGANFELKSNAKNRFMASKSASNMFNLTAEYGEQYPGSAKLFITDAGTSSGTPAPGHQTHNGSAFDVRYLDGSGNNVHSTNGAAIADTSRMLWFIDAARANGFTYILSSRPDDLGTSKASQRVYDEHEDHLHVGLHLYQEP